ncbi:MAG TPA: hypothetical protein VH679_12700 [Vicinamibacterales bacterium]|jgi:hypothetical protein
MQTLPPPVESSNPWISVLLVLVAFVVLVGLYLWSRNRLLPGDHVFRASRLSKGNRLFPAQVQISPTSVTLFRPQWIGKREESIHMAHVASIKIDTNVIFANVFIETTGGHNPIVCYGHKRGDAVEMKKLIERFQTDYYKGPQKPELRT